MKVYRNISEIDSGKKSVVTVGTFDGFHLGHQSILEKIRNIARQKPGLQTTIITFDPHPKKVVGNKAGADIKILTTTKEKLQIFAEAQVDRTVVIHFTPAFASLSSAEFIEDILVRKLSVNEMVIGYDHHFGRNREGGIEELKLMGERWQFTVHQVPQLEKDGQLISSTLIRKLIQEGNVEKAAHFMGRPYTIHGTVIKGDGRGRLMGFPTANIEVDHEDKLVPARGVYAVDVQVEDKIYKAMMNIGIRPTFDLEYLTLEVHLFKFDDFLYEKELKISFKKFIRQEKKFSGLEELKSQLEKDKMICENI